MSEHFTNSGDFLISEPQLALHAVGLYTLKSVEP
jgi:hypothetical protein